MDINAEVETKERWSFRAPALGTGQLSNLTDDEGQPFYTYEAVTLAAIRYCLDNGYHSYQIEHFYNVSVNLL